VGINFYVAGNNLKGSPFNLSINTEVSKQLVWGPRNPAQLVHQEERGNSTCFPGKQGTAGQCPNKTPLLRPVCSVRARNFFIFILSRFCKNILSVINFAKIYTFRRGSRCQRHKVVAHGGRSHQEWARTLNAASHGVMSLTPWATTLGA
jgi:hypothetical protein